MDQYPPTRTYAEFNSAASALSKFRASARDRILRILALGKNIKADANWIRFPYYHHIFEDERSGFESQLADMENLGEFISIDGAIELITRNVPIEGRYFSVSFDDGFKCCASGAMPILAERNIPAIFYIVTDFVGKKLLPGDPRARETFGFQGTATTLEFMSWDDCREMIRHGMTIGSHSASHSRLIDLSDAEMQEELAQSKGRIEQELGVKCAHFCAPYGIEGRHFEMPQSAHMARRVGYASFATGHRDAMTAGGDVFALRRDHMLAHAGNHQHRYFFSRPA